MKSQRTGETSHPIEAVAVPTTAFEGCGTKDCRAWGIGLLEINEVDERTIRTRLILTAAGCRICAGPAMITADVGPLGSVTVPLGAEAMASVVSHQQGEAKVELGQRVQAIIDRPT